MLQESQIQTSKLLQRGELALEVLRSKQLAAEFQAQAAELSSAILQAKAGNPELLAQWLEQPLESDRVPLAKSIATAPAKSQVFPSTEKTLLRMDRAHGKSPWPAMLAGAAKRRDEILAWVPISGRKTQTQNHSSVKTEVVQSVTPNWLAAASTPKQGTHTAKRKLGGLAVSGLVHVIFVGLMLCWTIRALDQRNMLSLEVGVTETSMTQFESAPQDLADQLDSPLEQAVSNEMESVSVLDRAALSTEPRLTTDSITGISPMSPAATSNRVGNASRSGLSSLSQVHFFGAQAQGNTFVYVVDSSGSMRRDRAFEAAKAEVLRSLASLQPTQRYYVLFFSEELEKLSLRGNQPEAFPIYATPENLLATSDWVNRVRIRGGKSPNDALDFAIQLEPDAIFLLFDGDTRVDVAAHLQKTNRVYDLILGTIPRVSIHTVGFYSEDHSDLMRQIASENRGSYRFVPKPISPGKMPR